MKIPSYEYVELTAVTCSENFLFALWDLNIMSTSVACGIQNLNVIQIYISASNMQPTVDLHILSCCMSARKPVWDTDSDIKFNLTPKNLNFWCTKQWKFLDVNSSNWQRYLGNNLALVFFQYYLSINIPCEVGIYSINWYKYWSLPTKEFLP